VTNLNGKGQGKQSGNASPYFFSSVSSPKKTLYLDGKVMGTVSEYTIHTVVIRYA
jgi:hypothetical protein